MMLRPLLLDLSDADFFAALAFIGLYYLSLLVSGLLLLWRLLRPGRLAPLGWVLGLCGASLLWQFNWWEQHQAPGVEPDPSWRHIALPVATALLTLWQQWQRWQKRRAQ
jgi:hypothetical protein